MIRARGHHSKLCVRHSRLTLGDDVAVQPTRSSIAAALEGASLLRVNPTPPRDEEPVGISARHRKAKPERTARPQRRRRRGSKALRVLCTYVAAGVTVAGTCFVSTTVAQPPAIRAATADVRLAGDYSNIPANLAIDILNIPANYSKAISYAGTAMIYSGPWFVVGSTNIWGVDPGDPGHFMAVVNLIVPFPALSGLGLDEFDQNGLGQQIWYFNAAELPVSPSCDDDGCIPMVPLTPITGISLIDPILWSVAILGGQEKFPLLDNWLKVPMSELMAGYTFTPDKPGYSDPAGPVYGWDAAGFEGTHVENGQDVMPWAGDTFTLDLSKPFQNYFDHLMADPSTNRVQIPDVVAFGRALQTLFAGLVIAFDPITPGSFFCPGDCSYLPDFMDYPAIAKYISDAWPGNPLLDGEDGWLTHYANGTANVPTTEQVQKAIDLKEGHFWDFGNQAPPADWITGFNFNSLAPSFHALWTALGLRPPPLHEPLDAAPAEAGGEPGLLDRQRHPVAGSQTEFTADTFARRERTSERTIDDQRIRWWR